MKKIIVACVAAFMLTGCSSPEVEQPVVETATETITEVQTESAVAAVDEEPVDAVSLPEGYPHIVPLSEVPENMQWALEGAGTGEVVAVAPGVWAELAPGATMEDAVNAQIFSGHCASKKALERDYLNGEPTAGNCW